MNVPVSPVGAPLNDNFTGAVTDDAIFTVRLTGNEPPRFRMTALPTGTTEIGGAVMVRVTRTVFVTPPAVAITYIVPLCAGVEAAALMVRVLEPAPGEASEAGEKLAVIPWKSPSTENDTADWNPPETAMVA